MADLTEQKQLNTTTGSFDVQFRYFSGPSWTVLIDGGLSSLSPWTAPDTGKPVAWTEITSRVSYASRFTQSLRGNSIVWSAELSGWEYDDTLLGVGIAVICWRRIYRPSGTAGAPAGWQDWERLFLGEFVEKVNRVHYTAGREWTRSVAGYDNYLSRYNSPRLVTGKIRVTEGGSATASEELAQPELEADKGEFVGGTANVDARNVIDGNRNTVYISDIVPSSTQYLWPVTLWDGSVQITELFFKALPGWPIDRSWWVEVRNCRSQNQTAWCHIKGCWYDPTGETSPGVGGTYHYWEGNGGDAGSNIDTDHVGLFVAHRKTFDDLTGGDNIGAEFIYDVSQHGEFKLTNDSCIVAGSMIMAWAPGGAARYYHFTHVWGDWNHNGATIDSDAFDPGESYWHKITAGPVDHGWVINPMPHPGANSNGQNAVFVRVELPDNVCVTLDEISAASTTIRLDNYRSWLIPPPRGGESFGYINGAIFSWTRRDATGLHGVTWTTPPGAPIPAGTRCYPYVNGVSQTGYPLVSTTIARRKFPTISHYQVYWSPYTVEIEYPGEWWTNEYDAHFHDQQGNTQNLRLTDSCLNENGSPRWVRSILYLIYGMTDGGRVKVNEVEAEMSQLALESAGSSTLDEADVTALARYLWVTWAGLPEGDFVDSSTVGAHLMGQHALAIVPIARVFDDLARGTGCYVYFRPSGGVEWLDDPWWPRCNPVSLMYNFTADSIREVVEFSSRPVYVDYVILNALSLEGDPHSLRYVYPQPFGMTEPPQWAMVTEINDRVIARDADAQAVASMELDRLVAEGKRCRLSVKGVGEWCRPGHKVRTYFDVNGDGSPELMSWLIDSTITTTRVDDLGMREYTTDLILRGFRG